ncbi:MAG: zinc-ribbon domain-containing protein [Thermoplasmatales archaeon]|nr:zinc-ribbon domain-containing protein [Thermoplasmatales archaeon]
MKYCTKCGAPNEDDAVFCKQCGSPLPMESVPPRQQQSVPTGTYQQVQTPPQSPNNIQQPGMQSGQNPPQSNPPQGNYPPPYGSIPRQQFSEFLSVDNTILMALIFSGISVLVFFIETIYSVISLLSLSAYAASLGPSYSYLYSGAIAGAYVAIFIYLVVMVIGIFVFLKTWKIYNMVKQRRYQEAYREDTIMWGVMGIIFGLIITGVFLILLRGELEKNLGAQRT